MTKKEAFEQLRSSELEKRLAAAQALLKAAKTTDLPALKAACERERSPWVLNLLKQIIATVGGDQQEPIVFENDPPEIQLVDKRESELKAIEQITKIFLHELAPIVGRLEVQASQEVTNYQNSKFSLEIAHLQRFISAMRNLSDATKVPQNIELNLAQTIRDIVSRISNNVSQNLSTNDIF
jgi:hypothetical protein